MALMFELTIVLELGPIYKVTYRNDSVRKFQVRGGDPPKVLEFFEDGRNSKEMELANIFVDFKKIEVVY